MARLESDVSKLRTELATLSSANDSTSSDLARLAPEVQSLGARTTETQARIQTLADDVSRLSQRVDATDRAVADARARVDALAVPVATPSAQATTPPVVPAPRRVPASMPPPFVPPTPPTVSSPTTPTASTPAPPSVSALSPPAVSTPPRPSATTPPVAAPAPAPPLERGREAQSPRGIAPEQEYSAALQTFRSREHGQAVLDFLDFIAKYPRHPLAANAQYWIGEAYYAQRDYRQALLEFQKVFEYGPAKAPDALVKMGMCWVQLRDVRRAHDLWQRAVREHPRAEAAATAQQLLHAHAAARR